nr:alpha-hydroxy-acid oxidizing protein [Bacillus sp. ISL-57]
MEEVADVMDTSPRWYQLCWSKDRNIAASMLRRAEAAGYSACCYTRYPDDGMARVRSCKYVSSILVWRRTR